MIKEYKKTVIDIFYYLGRYLGFLLILSIFVIGNIRAYGLSNKNPLNEDIVFLTLGIFGLIQGFHITLYYKRYAYEGRLQIERIDRIKSKFFKLLFSIKFLIPFLEYICFLTGILIIMWGFRLIYLYIKS